VLFFGVLPRSAPADTPVPSTVVGDSVSTEGGYAWPSRALGTTGRGFTASVIYGHPFLPHFSLEVNLHGSIFESGVPDGTDFYQKGLNLDAVYSFNDRQSWFVNPFLLAGLGGAYDDFNPDNLDRGVLLEEAGLGVISRPLLRNGLRLRLDARWVHDPNEGGHSEYRGMLGLYMPLGWVQAPPPPPPATIEIREVVKEVVREVPRAWVDSDGDGVDDDHDHCPNTPRGARVDANGCVIAAQTIELRGVTFNLNQATLTPNAETVLDSVVPAFKGQPSLRAEVAGHTDSRGSAAYNLNLSQQRAESVRQYLIAHGARPEQLSARGYGKSELRIDPEKSDSDRERNRRVELRARGQQE
jgi:OOP family OmpA-OmpF porin